MAALFFIAKPMLFLKNASGKSLLFHYFAEIFKTLS